MNGSGPQRREVNTESFKITERLVAEEFAADLVVRGGSFLDDLNCMALLRKEDGCRGSGRASADDQDVAMRLRGGGHGFSLATQSLAGRMV